MQLGHLIMDELPFCPNERTTLMKAIPQQKQPKTEQNLTVFFALAYLALGIATQFGIMSQPKQYYIIKELHHTAPQKSSYKS